MKKSQMKVWIQTRHLRTLKCMNKQVFFCLFFLVCKNRYATACKDLLTVANPSTNTNTEPELNQLWNFDEWKPTLSSDTRWNPVGGHDKKKWLEEKHGGKSLGFFCSKVKVRRSPVVFVLVSREHRSDSLNTIIWAGAAHTQSSTSSPWQTQPLVSSVDALLTCLTGQNGELHLPFLPF